MFRQCQSDTEPTEALERASSPAVSREQGTCVRSLTLCLAMEQGNSDSRVRSAIQFRAHQAIREKPLSQ
jgi:hypothetical protein